MNQDKQQSQPARVTSLIIVAWLCLVLSLALTSCELLELFKESEQAQMKCSSEEWMEVHGLTPLNDDGSVNPDGVAKVAKRVFTDSTGDPEVDAALDSDGAISKIKEADRLNEKAWEERDDAYVNKAIKLRPEDWTYRISRAALNIDAYVNPNWKKVDGDFQAAEKLLGTGKQERILDAEYSINCMERVKKHLTKIDIPGEPADLWHQPYACEKVFTQLAHYYNILADQTGHSDYRELAQQNQRDVSMCSP